MKNILVYLIPRFQSVGQNDTPEIRMSRKQFQLFSYEWVNYDTFESYVSLTIQAVNNTTAIEKYMIVTPMESITHFYFFTYESI